MSTNLNHAAATDDQATFTAAGFYDSTTATFYTFGDNTAEVDVASTDGMVKQVALDFHWDLNDPRLPVSDEPLETSSPPLQASGSEAGSGSAILASPSYNAATVCAFFVDATGSILPIEQPVSKLLHVTHPYSLTFRIQAFSR